MSIIGTRPPLISETNLYELHHRATIGDVKIYYYDFDKKRTKNYGRAVSSVINEKITQLSEKFCSLGQTLNYYQQLKNNCPNDYLDILNRLNDIAICKAVGLSLGAQQEGRCRKQQYADRTDFQQH